MNQAQLFDGRELQAVDYVLKLPDLKRTAGEMARCTISGLEHEFKTPKHGERFVLNLTVRTSHIDHGADIDEEGNEKSEFARTVELLGIKSSLSIVRYISAEEADRQFLEAHGATG